MASLDQIGRVRSGVANVDDLRPSDPPDPVAFSWTLHEVRSTSGCSVSARAQRSYALASTTHWASHAEHLEELGAAHSATADCQEQHEIVRRVEALFAYADRLEARYTTARAQVERLTPALLAKAFRGELVPQDPNDEPASVLLERIRASRAAAGEKPPRKVRTERKPMTTTLTTG